MDKQELKDTFNKLNVKRGKYNILLSHSPIDICNEEYLKDSNIDLVLCGHMHGGVLPNFLRKKIKNGGITFICPPSLKASIVYADSSFF